MQHSPMSALLKFVSSTAGFDAAQEEKLGPVTYLDFQWTSLKKFVLIYTI